MEKINYDLKIGYAKIDITPPMGTNLVGYFIDRIADGVLDPLEAVAVAVCKNEPSAKPVVLITLDNEGATTAFVTNARKLIAEKLGLEIENIFIHSTHTHLSPRLGVDSQLKNDVDKKYVKTVYPKLVKLAKQAIKDLTPARMGYAIGKAEKIGFNRRYLMKDGSVKTNPGVNNPDIVKSIGLLDESLNVVRFEREDGKNVVIANYGNHPDTIGKTKVSGDWPALTRRIFEKAVTGAKCIFFNGAQGDINHVNVAPKDGDLNGMFMDFDDVSRGYSHAVHMGNVVAGGIMQVYEKVKFVEASEVKALIKVIDIPTNMPKKEDMEQARYIAKMHAEGRDEELPYKGMLLTTFVAEALRMIRFENGPETVPMALVGVKIGEVAMLGIPGEPFTGIGLGLKQSKDFKVVMPVCFGNGEQGYFPMQDSYDEGGYEARSSEFKAGVAELIVKEGLALLKELKG